MISTEKIFELNVQTFAEIDDDNDNHQKDKDGHHRNENNAC